MAADEKVILTEGKKKELEEELDDLKVNRRREVAAKIKEARAKQDMSWRHNWHPSDESRRKMSLSHIGQKHTDEQKRKASLVSKKNIEIVREKYKNYKSSGGQLNWNDFQKALKKGEI